jgi:hypothetical protein
VEYFGPTDLRPGGPALIYAWRVCPADRSEAVGVLCLVFRFQNECERIFRTFVPMMTGRSSPCWMPRVCDGLQ